MKICRKCGAQLPPGTIFCTVCGSKLDITPQTDLPPTAAGNATGEPWTADPSFVQPSVPPQGASPGDVTGNTYEPAESNASTAFATAPPAVSGEEPESRTAPFVEPENPTALPVEPENRTAPPVDPENPTAPPVEPGNPPAPVLEQAGPTDAPAGGMSCAACGAPMLSGRKFCPYCGAKAALFGDEEGIVPISRVMDHDQFGAAPPPPAPVKVKKPLALVIIIAAVVLLAAVVGLVAWKVVPALTGGKEDSTLVYVQAGDILKFVSPDMDSPEEVSSSFALPGESQWIGGMLIEHSEDGRYLGYLAGYSSTEWYDGYGDLYVRDLQSRSKDGNRDRGWKIASDVRPGFVFSDDGKYILYHNSDGELYASNFAESWKLDSDVYAIYLVEGGKVLYNKNPGDDYGLETDFYIHSIGQNSSDKWKVGTEIYSLRDVSEGFAHIVYTKRGSEKDKNDAEEDAYEDEYTASSSQYSFDVYRYTLAEESSEALVKDIYTLYSSDAENGDLLYSVSQDGTLDYEHLVDDDLAEADALFKEPEISDYPLLNELNELQGDNYYDVNSEAEAFLEENLDALEAEYEQVAKDYEKYYENVLDISTREALRVTLKHDIEGGLFVVTGDLYLLRGGEKVKLDSNVVLDSDSGANVGITADLEENLALYVKSDLSKISKIKFSEYAENPTENLSDIVAKQLTNELYLTYLDGSPQKVAGVGSGKRLTRYFVSSEGDGLYYLESGQGDGTLAGGDLYYVPINKKQLGEAEKVDDNVGILNDLDSYQGAYLYGKDIKDDTFDLYTVDKGGNQLVSYDASYLAGVGYIAADSPYIYYTQEYNDERSVGDLYFYLKEKQLIDSDVHSFYYQADDAIYLLKDYRNGKGDLYFYDGKKTTVVDYDVVSVLN